MLCMMTLKGNNALQYMQKSPHLLFDGWSEQTKLYTGISKLPLSDCKVEPT